METEQTVELVATGEISRITGIYKCQQHPDHQINMAEGRTVLPCYKHFPGHSATWAIVSATQSPIIIKNAQSSIFSRLFSRSYWAVQVGARR